MITTRFYYERLNERDRKIYRVIYDGIKNYKSYVEVPGVKLQNQIVGYIYHCVLWDNPFFFAIGEYAMQRAVTPDGKKIRITSLCDSNSEKVYRKKVESVINEIMKTPGLERMSDFQKEVFVHDFIINNIEYDHSLGNGGARLEPYTVYGVFVERKAVCEGIAKAVKLLLNLLDVKCIVVDGTVDGHGHSWNMVKLEDCEYNLDVTFDMGLIVHKGMMRYDYFNFRNTDDPRRSLTNEHIMPVCTATKNNYVIRTGGFVSSYGQLVHYMEKILKMHKSCMYIKINSNVPTEFSKMGKSEFKDILIRAYNEATIKTHISSKAFLDFSESMGIYNIELVY